MRDPNTRGLSVQLKRTVDRSLLSFSDSNRDREYARYCLFRGHIVHNHPVFCFDSITRCMRLGLRRLRRGIPARSRSWGCPRASWRMRSWWKVNNSHCHHLRHIRADIQVGDSNGSHPPGISLVTFRILGTFCELCYLRSVSEYRPRLESSGPTLQT